MSEWHDYLKEKPTEEGAYWCYMPNRKFNKGLIALFWKNKKWEWDSFSDNYDDEISHWIEFKPELPDMIFSDFKVSKTKHDLPDNVR